MDTLSVCITTYNEAGNIAACLRSVSWADEIIVVDGQSTDATREIARKYTRKVFVRPNHANLNLNKNYGFSKARGEWVLCLDADESVPAQLKTAIMKILTTGTRMDGFLLPRKNYYFGRWLRWGGNYPDPQLRLFRRVKGRFPARHVHERLAVDGKVGRFKAAFEHFPYKDIQQYFHKFNFYTSFEGNFLYQKGQRITAWNAPWNLYGKHLFRLLRKYFLKGGFLDGWQGLLAHVFSMFTGVVSAGKLWEKQKQNKSRVHSPGSKVTTSS